MYALAKKKKERVETNMMNIERAPDPSKKIQPNIS